MAKIANLFQVLQEELVANKDGMPSAYVRLGRESQKVLNGDLQITLDIQVQNPSLF